jgi:hypothetical protein
VQFIISFLKHFDGDSTLPDSATREKLATRGLWGQIEHLEGTYTHHYPICIRRVLPDDTLMSMTAGMHEPAYAISFISYARPSQRKSFFAFAEVLCKSMATLFDGRPHWGKICPLSSDDVERLYPRCAQFRKVCAAFDPNRAFTSQWAQRLGLVERL